MTRGTPTHTLLKAHMNWKHKSLAFLPSVKKGCWNPVCRLRLVDPFVSSVAHLSGMRQAGSRARKSCSEESLHG
ncbi:hypothetical protein B296_00022515 [Ensete ventricosum]|uniref:Uncharacterized protein n=1 Tax=Ensete ventricosum TaxID=4639 RepID=A0A427A1X8_ENSVE|nr:hypothetical protein B296_00022515 [Ensete ventricosum]